MKIKTFIILITIKIGTINNTKFKEVILNIDSNYVIKQVNDRVFLVGSLNLSTKDNLLYHDIIGIINKGFKFIPSFFVNNEQFLLFLDYFFTDFLANFNKRIFFLNNSNSNSSQKETNFNIEDNLIKKLNLGKKTDKKFLLQNETIDFKFLIYRKRLQDRPGM